jgi:2-polyprenyl-3-methyl-5-hydroxy-6-metoxy-1,4-benzoquinol methylase
MLEKIDNCPICGNNTFEYLLLCKDHMVSQETFTIQKCSACQLLFTNPRPDKHQIGSYYKSDLYISHTDKSNSVTNSIYKLARKFTLKQKLKLINRLSADKSILDFGCGTGDFLTTCKNDQWNINGFEPDEDARSIAESKTKITIYNKIDNLKKLSEISIVTLWHVLEHIHDLNETLDTLVNLMRKKGKIVIAVPNYNSFDAKIYQEYWAAYDVPRHLYHFSKATISKLLNYHSLKITEILPMKLDSFYVSLLSEKYKNGQGNIVKSIINGCKSNIYANKNQDNYSSLIYIAEK